jgi:hypothetical protein
LMDRQLSFKSFAVNRDGSIRLAPSFSNRVAMF